MVSENKIFNYFVTDNLVPRTIRDFPSVANNHLDLTFGRIKACLYGNEKFNACEESAWDMIRKDPLALAFYAYVKSAELTGLSVDDEQRIHEYIHAKIMTRINDNNSGNTRDAVLTQLSGQSAQALLELDRVTNGLSSGVSTAQGYPDVAGLGVIAGTVVSVVATYGSELETSQGKARHDFFKVHNGDDNVDSKQFINAWKSVFMHYDAMLQDKNKYVIPAWLIAVIFGLTIALAGALGLVLVVGSGGVPLFVAAAALGIVSGYTNYRYAYGTFKKMFSQWGRGWSDFRAMKAANQFFLFVFSGCAIAASLVLALATSNGIYNQFQSLAQLIVPNLSVSVASLGYVMWPVFAITIFANTLMFIKSCVDIYRKGGLTKVLGDVYTASLMKVSADGSSSRVKKIAFGLMVVLLACGICSVAFLGLGADGAMSNPDIMEISLKGIRIAMIVVAAAGMSIFILRQTLGFAHTVEQVRQATQWEEAIGSLFNADKFCKFVVKNWPVIVGTMVCILCMSVPPATVAVGLAALFVSVIVNMIYKKLFGAYIDDKLQPDVMGSDGTTVAPVRPGDFCTLEPLQEKPAQGKKNDGVALPISSIEACEGSAEDGKPEPASRWPCFFGGASQQTAVPQVYNIDL